MFGVSRSHSASVRSRLLLAISNFVLFSDKGRLALRVESIEST